MSHPCSVLARVLGVPQRGRGEGLLEGCVVHGRAPEVLEGGPRAGLGLQAPVGGVEEEYQAAAQEGTQAGHRQHGHWGDTAAGLRPGHGASRAQLTPLTTTTVTRVRSRPSPPAPRAGHRRCRWHGLGARVQHPTSLCHLHSVSLSVCVSPLSLPPTLSLISFSFPDLILILT